MPEIRAIPAISYTINRFGRDLSRVIAPPYDVLDERSKAALLERDAQNIVAVDLPHLPAKTVGPDETYEQAGAVWRDWLSQQVLTRRSTPALFVYQQTYVMPVTGKPVKRRGLFANVKLQAFGKSPDGRGGVHPHEQTFSGPKEDRFKLMKATKAQLSPIFGLYSDATGQIGSLLQAVIDRGPSDCFGITANDDVRHDLWVVGDGPTIQGFVDVLADSDIFIADGHHRYNTALNYQRWLGETQGQANVTPTADACLFVLVAMQDPGMIVLPTHRVLGGMSGFSFERLVAAAQGKLDIQPFAGTDLAALEAALPAAGPHAMGLYVKRDDGGFHLAIATTTDADPLAATHGRMSDAWRQLDVAILQHLVVEGICQPTFAGGGEVTWKFPHDLEELAHITASEDYQMGVVMQATPLDAVRRVSEAGELMPQKSTFFYPKLATGLVINPLE